MLRRTLELLAVLFLGCYTLAVTDCFAQETFTITSYYPSPKGSYQELGTNKLAVHITGVAVPSEYAAMTSGDAHIGRSLIVGAGGGSGFAYDEGAPSADGTVLIKGNVGIGTTTLTYRLNVSGDINVTGDLRKSGTAYIFPDYVFKPEYKLMSLEELKAFLSKNQHLPNMPSAEEVSKEGVRIFEQNKAMLEKLEEAYLYILQLEQRIGKLETQLADSRAVSN
jgi:hypothetical protein